MKNTLRGRPRLDIPLERIINVVRQTGYAARAAEELGCSDAYIHQQLKSAGLSLVIRMTKRKAQRIKRSEKGRQDYISGNLYLQERGKKGTFYQ